MDAWQFNICWTNKSEEVSYSYRVLKWVLKYKLNLNSQKWYKSKCSSKDKPKEIQSRGKKVIESAQAK